NLLCHYSNSSSSSTTTTVDGSWVVVAVEGTSVGGIFIEGTDVTVPVSGITVGGADAGGRSVWVSIPSSTVLVSGVSIAVDTDKIGIEVTRTGTSIRVLVIDTVTRSSILIWKRGSPNSRSVIRLSAPTERWPWASAAPKSTVRDRELP